MASRSLRRFDVQAKVSLIISILAGVCFVTLVVLFARNYSSELGAVIYRTGSLFAPLFLVGTAATMLFSTVGLVLGFNSAGQRRNDLQGRSWAGFFLGTAFLAGAIICFALFWLLRMPLK